MKIGRKYREKEKIQILIKSLIFCILRIYIFSFYAFLFFRSLADAECLFAHAKFRKDVLKDFVGDDGAAGGDGTESVDDLADLFAQQVGGKPVAQAVESPVESLAGRREGFVMAAVRNDRIAVVECVGIDCPAQGFAQPVETRALFRRDADDVFGKR